MIPDSNLSYVLLSITVYALSLTVIYQNALDESKKLIQNNQTTLLIIAHPDDESMFFGPTIIRKLENKLQDENLSSEESSNKFYLLCITEGNQYGLGYLRRLELIESATKLGIKSENVKILDDIKWLDGDNQNWHKQSLQKLIIDEILANNITELITFDEYGVSGHLNHRTLFKIMKSIKLKLNFIKFYTLRSINLIQKYSAFLDFSLFYLFIDKSSQLFLLSLDEYFKLIDAFKSHKTQLVWFRKLYIIFSKYMYINILDEYN